MLNFVGTVALGATIAMVLVGVASTALTSVRSRLTLAAIAGAWVAVVVGITAAKRRGGSRGEYFLRRG